MPIFILIVGILLVATGLNNTTADLGALLKAEFTTAPSFVPWLFAILGVGSLGYVDSLKPIANALLALILIVIVLTDKGFANNFVAALGIKNGGTTIFNNPIPDQSSVNTTGNGSGSSGSSSGIGGTGISTSDLSNIAKLIAQTGGTATF